MLDAWLKGERKHLAHGMQKQIRKRQQGLARAAGCVPGCHRLCSPGSTRTPRSADAVALEDFVRAADAMPLLDAENLHDFRKATKKARYVAESGAEGQAYSSVAKALKRVQDAIGEWHDWLCLREEAEAALGKDAPDLTCIPGARGRAPFCRGDEDHPNHARPAFGRVDGQPAAISQPRQQAATGSDNHS